MENKKLKTLLIIVTAVFIVASFALMFGSSIFGGKSDAKKGDSTLMPTATGTTNEIKGTIVVEQDFINSTDTISSVGIVFSRLAYKEGIDIAIELLAGKEVLASNTVSIAVIEDQHRTYIEPSVPLTGMANKKLTVRIYPIQKEDTGLVIMMDGNADASFLFGGKTIKGSLCFSVTE